jgi:hypothetical protein
LHVAVLVQTSYSLLGICPVPLVRRGSPAIPQTRQQRDGYQKKQYGKTIAISAHPAISSAVHAEMDSHSFRHFSDASKRKEDRNREKGCKQ